MALVAHFDLEVHQMDVKTTFLNYDLCEDVYMDQPNGFKEKGKEHFCIYLKNSGSKFIIPVLYVEDILLVCNYMNFLLETKQMLTNLFCMKDLGDTSFILGIEFHRDRSRSILHLSQNNYIERVLNRFNIKICNLYVATIQKASKRVMRYLQCTKEHLLTYKRFDNLEVIGCSDFDYDGCLNGHKSISGHLFMLAGGDVSWKSVK
ncbi:hypothetical protein CR513_29489, partial [Mucuna pruriens]